MWLITLLRNSTGLNFHQVNSLSSPSCPGNQESAWKPSQATAHQNTSDNGMSLTKKTTASPQQSGSRANAVQLEDTPGNTPRRKQASPYNHSTLQK